MHAQIVHIYTMDAEKHMHTKTHTHTQAHTERQCSSLKALPKVTKKQ